MEDPGSLEVARPPDEDIEKEVEAVVASCVYSVAARHFVDENRDLFEQLEAMQLRVWAKDEVRTTAAVSSSDAFPFPPSHTQSN